MCEAVLHSHTGLRVSTNFQRWQFPHQVAFPKKRGFLSSRLSRCPTTRAARRHNAGGVFLRHPTASSPTCPSYLPLPFSSRHTAFTRDRTSRTTRERDGTARRNFACTSTRTRSVTAKAQRTALSSTTSAPVLLQTDDFRTRIDDFEIPLLLKPPGYFTRFYTRARYVS